MTIIEIGRDLLARWELPPDVALSSADGALSHLMTDVRSAYAAELWKPVCLLTGQMIEALLTMKLNAVSPAPDLRRVGGLYQLVELARAYNVLPEEAPRRASRASFVSVRLLRNSAAHFSVAFTKTTPLRAVESIAIMICAAEAISPSLPEPSPQSLGDTEGSQRQSRLSLREYSDERFAEFSARAATLNFSPVVKLGRFLVKHGRPLDEFVHLVTSEFVYFVRQASRNNSTNLDQFVKVLKRCGLSDHARVFSALLPMDPDALSELLQQKTPATVAPYVLQNARADPHLFRAKFANVRADSDLVATFWRRVTEKDSGIGVVADILRPMPIHTKVAFMVRARTTCCESGLLVMV